MRSSSTTSASRGALTRMSVWSVKSDAIIKGSVAFFAPEIGMVPLSRRPPTMRMRSIIYPRWPALLPAPIAAKVGTLGFSGIFCPRIPRPFLSPASARHRLVACAAEVFATPPTAARRAAHLPLAGFGHFVCRIRFWRQIPCALPLARIAPLFSLYSKRQRPEKVRCRSSVVEHSLHTGRDPSSILSGSTRFISKDQRAERSVVRNFLSCLICHSRLIASLGVSQHSE